MGFVAAPILVGNGTVYFAVTRDAAVASDVPANFDALYVSGYSDAGDGGEGLYIKVPSDPGHIGAFETNNGLWFELTNNQSVYRAEAFGIFHSTNPNDTDLLNDAYAAVAAMGGATLYFQNRTYYFDTKTVVPIDGVATEGAGASAWLDFSADLTLAPNGIFQIAGPGVAAWNTVSTSIEEGDTVISGVGGSLAAFTQGADIMVRSTEYYRLHIYDTPKNVWSAAQVVAVGAIDFITGTWAVATQAGTTGGTAPAIGANPIVDNTVRWYTFGYTDPTQQKPRPNSTLVNLGECFLTTQGYNIVCVQAGVTAAAQPAGFNPSSAATVTDGAAKWRCFGYYNATRGEIFENAVASATAGAITISEPTQLSYAVSYPSGATFTVQVGVPEFAELTFRNIGIRGSGLTGVTLGAPDSHGDYSVVPLDVGIDCSFTKLTLDNVDFDGVEQFCVRAKCSITKQTGGRTVFSTTRIESQQYHTFAQAAGKHYITNPYSCNARHHCDGDGGGANTGDGEYRGVPQLIQVTGGEVSGCWQTPFSGHRDCLDIQVTNTKLGVLAYGIQNRNTKGTYTNVSIYGPQDAAGIALFDAPSIALFYYGGDLSLNNVRCYGNKQGFVAYDSDTFTSMGKVSGDIYVENAAEYSARIGAWAYDYASSFSLSVHSVDPGLDHIFVNGNVDVLSLPNIICEGGRAGLVIDGDVTVTKLLIGHVNMSGLSSSNYVLTNVAGGHVAGGYLQTDGTLAIDIENCGPITFGQHVVELPSGNGWYMRGDNDGFSVGDGQIVNFTTTPGQAYNVQNSNINGYMGRVDGNGTVSTGTSNSVAFGNSTNPTRTIATGAFTAPKSGAGAVFILVAGEGGVADDLVTINYTGQVGDVILLRRTGGDDITVKNATGNIRCGSDRLLNSDNSTISLVWNGATWSMLNFEAN